ncbi:hypothetical protein NDU88_006412 [Pleurodeles waltl]|uniref:Uncharacterized protein n=1 Tax=Pleurodeles waltl TaxID=8319 RepID=A0AAV7U0A0_PLEWA|nr:hypothetical protein NDU88_006412 [Pleurodeles waltl]
MLPVVQVSALVEGDTRPSPAALEGCPLGMMLVTVVEAAAVQVAVQMAVQVVVVGAVLTWVQVARLSCERGTPVPHPEAPCPKEDGPDVGLVAAVEPVDSEEEEAEEEDIDNRNNIVMQYFQ